jgi:3-hydroxybutyryl-CoA dehydrogenase
VDRAVAALRDGMAPLIARGKLSETDAQATIARIERADTLAQLADCELVVEAIVERLDAKQQLFRELETVVGPDSILATNTSSLSVTAIAAGCARPQRVVGWHFFNPVPRMKVVEVVQAPRTPPSIVAAMVALSKRVGHQAIVTSDSPGFVVNHAGRAFVTEGLKLLAERTAEHPVLDAILRAAGFRMGPFELLDLTGLDVSVPVMESIHSQFYGDDRYRPVALARTRLEAGLLGRKSGRGFYEYANKAAAPPPPDATAAPPHATFWSPGDGIAALPDSILGLLPGDRREPLPADADVILVAPLAMDLTSTVTELGLDASRAVAVDPIFGGTNGVTLMTCPATRPKALEAARALFAARVIPTFAISDSPGYVAPRVVASIVNLACEMAQQDIASPADIDLAVQLALGYPAGPFAWGDRMGAQRVLEVLTGLQSAFGDPRYRPSPWLVRRARLSLPLSAPERFEETS